MSDLADRFNRRIAEIEAACKDVDDALEGLASLTRMNGKASLVLSMVILESGKKITDWTVGEILAVDDELSRRYDEIFPATEARTR